MFDLAKIDIKNRTDQKLWIFGDSFTGINHMKQSWQYLLYEKFCGNEIYISSKSSRDTQTIIDIFLRNLYKIKSNDLVIIFLPTMARFRLPLETPSTDVEWSNVLFLENEKRKHLDYFISSQYYLSITDEPDPENSFKKIEFPLSYIDTKKFEKSVAIANISSNNYFNINDCVNSFTIGDINTMIQGSTSSTKNMNEILNSFKNYFPFQLYFVSWTDEYDTDIVEGKTKLTEILNEWHTEHHRYLETNGMDGRKDDFHWSKKMSKLFADYLIVKFSQFFNI